MARTVILCRNNKKKPHIKPGRVLYGASIAGATLEQLHSSTDRRKGQIMKYQMVNEELQIASCSIADLTMEQVQHFLKQWHPGDSIGTLTLFFENETGLLVLNRDNKNYETYKDIAEAYLKASKEEQEEIIEKAPKGLEETFMVLSNCIKRRTIGETCERAEQKEREQIAYMDRMAKEFKQRKDMIGALTGKERVFWNKIEKVKKMDISRYVIKYWQTELIAKLYNNNYINASYIEFCYGFYQGMQYMKNQGLSNNAKVK